MKVNPYERIEKYIIQFLLTEINTDWLNLFKGILSPDCFHNKEFKLVYETMIDLNTNLIVEVFYELQTWKMTNKVKPLKYWVELMDEFGDGKRINGYVNYLAEKRGDNQ